MLEGLVHVENQLQSDFLNECTPHQGNGKILFTEYKGEPKGGGRSGTHDPAGMVGRYHPYRVIQYHCSAAGTAFFSPPYRGFLIGSEYRSGDSLDQMIMSREAQLEAKAEVSSGELW